MRIQTVFILLALAATACQSPKTTDGTEKESGDVVQEFNVIPTAEMVVEKVDAIDPDIDEDVDEAVEVTREKRGEEMRNEDQKKIEEKEDQSIDEEEEKNIEEEKKLKKRKIRDRYSRKKKKSRRN